MKYIKRAHIYKSNNGNCTFDPKTGDAFSYRWWRFVAVIDGVRVFNDYRYSATTTTHQWKVRAVLRDLGLSIDVYAPFPQGIPNGLDREALFTLAEENICDAFLRNEAKRDDRNERARQRRAQAKARATALVTHAVHESQSAQMQTLTLINGGK